MRVHYAVHILASFHNLGVDENFGMAFVFAVCLFTRLDIDHDDMLRADFFETEAMRLHEDLVLPRNSHRNMAEDVVPVTFVSEYVARISEIFFELFDAGGHFNSGSL